MKVKRRYKFIDDLWEQRLVWWTDDTIRHFERLDKPADMIREVIVGMVVDAANGTICLDHPSGPQWVLRDIFRVSGIHHDDAMRTESFVGVVQRAVEHRYERPTRVARSESMP